MERRSTTLALCAVALLGLAFDASAAPITLTAVSTGFPTPIGIDHHAPTNSLVMSVNFASGTPQNFRRVLSDGTQLAFSTIAGFTDEVKIATAPAGSVFPAGTLFTGSGVDGHIVKIAPDGLSFLNPWVSLPGAGNGLMRGSLFVDRSGVYGGDLLAATTGGEIWRVDSLGAPTFIADVNTHLEGLISVPNNPAVYGGLAGKIIAGAEGLGLLYVFDNTGFVTTYNVGVNIEDIDLIPANENFFGVNFGTGRLLGSPASDWTGFVGDILLTQEFGGTSGLFTMSWNFGLNKPVAVAVPLAPGSFNPGQWEHVTFSTAGVVEIPPIPEPTSFFLLALGVGVLMRRRKRAA